MTLILAGSNSKSIAMTADGISWLTGADGVSHINDDKYQKIFPFESRPLAIAHYGRNTIDDIPIKTWVEEFYAANQDMLNSASIEQVCDELRVHFDLAARRRLQHLEAGHHIGFVIGGINSSGDAQTWFIEWPKHIVPVKFEDMRIFGDARFLIEHHQERRLGKYFPQTSALKRLKLLDILEYENSLYRVAEKEQLAKGLRKFGGHKHQLKISGVGCRWAIEPKLD